MQHLVRNAQRIKDQKTTAIQEWNAKWGRTCDQAPVKIIIHLAQTFGTVEDPVPVTIETIDFLHGQCAVMAVVTIDGVSALVTYSAPGTFTVQAAGGGNRVTVTDAAELVAAEGWAHYASRHYGPKQVAELFEKGAPDAEYHLAEGLARAATISCIWAVEGYPLENERSFVEAWANPGALLDKLGDFREGDLHPVVRAKRLLAELGYGPIQYGDALEKWWNTVAKALAA